jgi:hypothetical protein
LWIGFGFVLKKHHQAIQFFCGLLIYEMLNTAGKGFRPFFWDE